MSALLPLIYKNLMTIHRFWEGIYWQAKQITAYYVIHLAEASAHNDLITMLQNGAFYLVNES